jgi:hypothetical protein
VAGHSAGAAVLVTALAEQPPGKRLAAIVLIAAPFAGEGGWPTGEFGPAGGLGAGLPPGAPVPVCHGLRDEAVPSSHAGLSARAIPQAQVHQLPGRDHQLNNDRSDAAQAIGSSRPRPVTDTQRRHHVPTRRLAGRPAQPHNRAGTPGGDMSGRPPGLRQKPLDAGLSI